MAGPQQERIAPLSRTKGLDAVLKSYHTSPHESWADDACVGARVERREEHVKQNEQHQHHACRLLKPLK
jgi:hypothetical protein